MIYLKKLSVYLLLLLILGLLSLFFYKGTVASFPRTVHAWAQSDHYALALNFENNHYNLFKPETFCLNPQFPATPIPQPEQGVTRVDFPIHNYAVAVLMKISGDRSPLIYRLYILCWGLLGLFFLFLLTQRLTNSTLHACFLVVFAFTAPVYTYYQCGFLPSIPALSCLIGAYYFYLRFRRTNRPHFLPISMVFFTLAALARTPFAIFLIALTGQMILYAIRDRKWLWKEMLWPASSFVVIGAYFLYNLYLGNKYGSVFLSEMMPPSSFEEAKEIMSTIKEQWKFEYLTGWHYVYLGLLFVVSVVFMILRKKPAGSAKGGWLHLGIASIGVVMYFILMMRQFSAHDYYFLDTFFPLILLGAILLVMPLPVSNKLFSIISLFVLLAFSILFILRSEKNQQQRYTTDATNPTEITIRDFQGAAQFLDQCGIARDARLLVLNSYTPNIALILSNRKGYSVFCSEAGEASSYLDRPWDVVLIQENMPVSDLFNKDSMLFLQLERVASNGRIGVYKRCPLQPTLSIREFLKLTPEAVVFDDTLTFESDSISKLASYNALVTSGQAHSHQKSVDLNAETEFFEVLNNSITALQGIRATRLVVAGWIKCDTALHAALPELILTLDDAQGNYLYTPVLLSSWLPENNGDWQYFSFQYGITEIRNPEDHLKLYFWNNGKGHYYFDDITLTLAR